jgi:lipopolysaccharide export system protein LptC
MALDPTAILDDSAALPPPSAPREHPLVRQPQRQPWMGRAREALWRYLPVAMMVLLALATWWLARQIPVTPAPMPERTLRHEADYTMRNALLQRFDAAGRLAWQIQGTVIQHYPDTESFEVTGVRVRSMDPEGRVTEAVAQRAEVRDDGSQVRLLGRASVERAAWAGREAMRVEGEFLHLLVQERRVRSHLPVTFRLGASVVRAAGFEHDDLQDVSQLTGPVQAVVQPTAIKRSASASTTSASP